MSDEKHTVTEVYGLYYRSKLIGIITNPDLHGSMVDICEFISPCEGNADYMPFKGDKEALEKVLSSFPLKPKRKKD